VAHISWPEMQEEPVENVDVWRIVRGEVCPCGEEKPAGTALCLDCWSQLGLEDRMRIHLAMGRPDEAGFAGKCAGKWSLADALGGALKKLGMDGGEGCGSR